MRYSGFMEQGAEAEADRHAVEQVDQKHAQTEKAAPNGAALFVELSSLC